MKRVFSALICSAGLACAGALAQGWPEKPVRFVVGFTPGGPSDIIARALGQKLAESWGQQVVIENRPGAGGNIAAELVAKSAADGNTWLLGNNSILATNQSLYAKLGYDPVKDFAPVALVAIQPNILVVNPNVPVSSVKELIALAKAKPEALNYASSGSGAAAHLAGELFKAMTGVQMVHIPYKGAQPALIQFREGARSRSCAERRPEAVRRMARGAELDRVQRLRQPAADIVAERDRAKERRAARALAFRHGERRSDDPAARVRLRGRMRIVGLVGVAEHAVRERRIDRACHDAAADDRGLFRPAQGLRERDRLFSRRQARAGQHRGERVEQVMLGFLEDRGRERPAQGASDIGAQGQHDRGNLRGGFQAFLLDLVRHFK